MHTRRPVTLAFLVPLLLMTVADLNGDQRLFVWTYEYKTMHRREVELEQYTTFSTFDLDNRNVTTSTSLEIELEVGMTDRFDVGLYHVFSQAPKGGMAYDGFKVRFRYRFGEKGLYFLDPLLYLEYKGFPTLSKHGLEGKIILAKEVGNYTLVLNPIVEFEVKENEPEMEWEYASGLSYRFSKIVNVGFEMKGSSGNHYIGPVIAHGDAECWLSLGFLRRVTGRSGEAGDREIRLIIGIGL